MAGVEAADDDNRYGKASASDDEIAVQRWDGATMVQGRGVVARGRVMGDWALQLLQRGRWRDSGGWAMAATTPVPLGGGFNERYYFPLFLFLFWRIPFI